MKKKFKTIEDTNYNNHNYIKELRKKVRIYQISQGHLSDLGAELLENYKKLNVVIRKKEIYECKQKESEEIISEVESKKITT